MRRSLVLTECLNITCRISAWSTAARDIHCMRIPLRRLPLAGAGEGYDPEGKTLRPMLPRGRLRPRFCKYKPFLASGSLMTSLPEAGQAGGVGSRAGPGQACWETRWEKGRVSGECHPAAASLGTSSCAFSAVALCLPGICKWYSNQSSAFSLSAHTPQLPSSK